MKKCFLLILLLFLNSCGKPSQVTFSQTSSDNFPLGEKINFSQLKTEILVPHCVRCHANAGNENGIQSWVSARKPELSSLFLVAENGSMPKDEAPLTTRELEVIKAYINGLGALPNPTPEPLPSPTGQTVSFNEVKTQILTPYRCTNCHSMNTEAGVARYINKTHPDQSRLYLSVSEGSMPQGGQRVSASKQQLLLQYVRDYVQTH